MAAADFAPLAALAVQYWKLCAAFEHELTFASEQRAAAGAAQLRFARRRLEAILGDAELCLTTWDGAAFTPDIPATPVNAEDVAAGVDAVVDSTVEPTITGSAGVVIGGKIILKEA